MDGPMCVPVPNRLSLVVATWNRASSLRLTLRALQAQEIRDEFDLEILVVDNGSTDDTPGVIKDAASGARWPVRYLAEPRQGKSFACNRAIREARGEWLVFTDDDVLPEAGWAQALVDAMRLHGADAAGGPVRPLWQAAPGDWLTAAPLRQHVWGILALLDRGEVPVMAKPTESNFLIGANMAFRAATLRRIGGFRTDLGPHGAMLMRGEDTELLARLQQRGGRVVYAPEAVVHHRVARERMSLAYARRRRFYGGYSDGLAGAGAPLWYVRQCVQDGARALWAYLRHRRVEGIQSELSCWAKAGRIAGAMRQAAHGSSVAVE